VYFDTSRYKPGPNTFGSASGQGTGRYDLWAANPSGSLQAPWIVAFKQLRQGVTNPTGLGDYVFVNQGKFQVMHAGLDDDWGSDSFQAMSVAKNGANAIYYPAGPFIGPIADTLTNFSNGTIEESIQK
jgi:hypothetical protein